MEISSLLWKCDVWHWVGSIFSWGYTWDGTRWYIVALAETFTHFKAQYCYRELGSKSNLTGEEDKIEEKQRVLQDSQWLLERLQINTQFIRHQESQALRFLIRQNLHSLTKANHSTLQLKRDWVTQPCPSILLVNLVWAKPTQPVFHSQTVLFNLVK